MSDDARVLVTGATGETGRRVVDRLRERDVAVRGLARNADKARAVLGDVDVHIGDIRDPRSLRGMADGVSAVIHTIGTRTYFGANGGAAVDVEGTTNLVDAISTTEPHLVFLSAFGVGRSSPFLKIFSVVLGNYFDHKTEAERIVRAAGVPLTVVRPVELRNRPPRALPLLNQDRALSLIRTVSRDQVAEVLVECALTPSTAGATFELCEGGERSLAEQLQNLRPDDEVQPPQRTPLFG